MGIIYRNPALVEIVAEIQWQLTPLMMPPGAAVDPFFAVMSEDLAVRLATIGFANILQMTPPNVPLELFAWKPVRRFDENINSWPKVQFGPGIFSVHMGGPQYTGWDNFRTRLISAVNALLAAYPSVEKFFKFKSIHLRYANAFTKAHGYQNNAQFTSDYLGLRSVLSDSYVERLGLRSVEIATASTTRFALPTMNESFGNIQISEARVNNQQPACFVQFDIETSRQLVPTGDAIQQWLDSAHVVAEQMFQGLTSEELKRIMKPEGTQ